MTPDDQVAVCARMIGFDVVAHEGMLFVSMNQRGQIGARYDPLTNDAQMVALVKQFRLGISPPKVAGELWAVSGDSGGTLNTNLNAAVVECVAKMEKDNK